MVQFWPKPTEEELNGFSFEEDGDFNAFGESFEAFQIDLDGNVVIKDCCITGTSDEYLKAMQDAGVYTDDREVKTLYLQGYMLEKPSESDPKIIERTATGLCIYFFKDEAVNISVETELTIKKGAKFFYTEGVSDDIKRSTFGELTNVSKTIDRIGGGNSQQFGHPKAGSKIKP